MSKEVQGVWTKCVHPVTDKEYWYNSETKESQWTQPAEWDDFNPSLGGSVPQSQAPQQQEKEKEQEKEKSENLDPDNDPNCWRSKMAIRDGHLPRRFYYNPTTRKRQWDKPACLGATDVNDRSNWRVAHNQAGRPYWYNKVTRERTWTNPFAGDEDSDDELEKKKEKDHEAQESGDEGDENEGDEGDTNEGDEETQDGEEKAFGEMDSPNGEEEEYDTYKFAKHRTGIINKLLRIGAYAGRTELLQHSNKMITKSLLKDNRKLDELSVQAFKNVMSYMGDRQSTKRDIMKHAQKMLRNLMNAPLGLRDEIYMQVIKQTTHNPKTNNPLQKAEERGWELMMFLLVTFPPSKRLKSFVLSHISKAKASTHTKVQMLARQCEDRLPKIMLLGQRKQVPGREELKCLQEGKQIPMSIALMNGTAKMLLIDSYMCVGDVEEKMVEKCSLVCRTPFSLYEYVDGEFNTENPLYQKDRMMDVVAAWENDPLSVDAKQTDNKFHKRGEKKKEEEKEVKIAYNKLVYKAKLVLKTTNYEVANDPQCVDLLYQQAKSDVMTERYPCATADMVTMAAMQLQATHGDYRPDHHDEKWIKKEITNVIPASLLRRENRTAIDSKLSSEWAQRVLESYTQVGGNSHYDATLNYLDYIQEWVFYGCTFFLVRQRVWSHYPDPIVLGINTEGLLFMHPEKKIRLENYAYSDIVNWGSSTAKFVVVVGNFIQQYKFIFKTKQGAVICRIIHDYVDYHFRNQVQEQQQRALEARDANA